MDENRHSNTPLNGASSAPAQPEPGGLHPEKGVRKRHTWLKWTGWIIGVPLGLLLISLIGISVFLTPDRLTSLINREASRYMEADITAHNVNYTLWRSFPRFRITSDSIVLRSRTLDSVPEAIRKSLPENADFLGSLKSFSGSINIVDLFMNRYVIHDVEVDGLSLNLVAYNDSINNYNIVPTSGASLKRVPYFSAELVSLRNPGVLSYYSKASDTRASLQLSELMLKRVTRHLHENSYKLTIGGKVTARSAGLDILHNFPFKLDGDLTLRFDPFGISLSDYAVDLGEIRSKLSMSVGIGDDPRIESFDYRIASINVMNLLGYIPREYIPSLQGLNMDLPISASAKLLSSWSLSSEVFPSIEVDFKVPEGDIDYTVSTSTGSNRGELMTYSLNHSPIEGIFVFDGKEPSKSYLDIPPFSVYSSGVDATLKGRVTDLTGDPLVNADLNLTADIADALHLLPSASPVAATGTLTSSTNLSFRLSSFSKQSLEDGLLDVRSSGNLAVDGLTMRYPQDSITLRVNHLALRLGESAESLTPTAITDPMSNISLNIDNADIATPFGQFKGRNITMLSHASKPGSLTPANLHKGLPLRFDLKGSKLIYSDPASGMTAEVTGLDVRDIVATTSPQSFRQALSDGLEVKAIKMRLNTGKSSYLIHSPALHVAVAERTPHALDSLPAILATPAVAQSAPAAKERPGTPAHSPELIAFSIPPQVNRLMEAFKFSTDLKARRVELDAPGFRDEDYLKDIDLSLNEEALTLRNLSMCLSGTPGSMHGKVSNLKNFLTLPASTENPIIIDLFADIDKLDINALTHNYVESQGGEKAVRNRPTSSPSDTVAMLVPRNILANIHAHVAESEYTNLNLTDIEADINVADGIARIGQLGLATSFGRAGASFVYDTSDLYHMNLGGEVHLNNIDIVKFFAKFHSLLEMMPQMKNLSGYISINGTLASDIFPTMYLNVPSARADLNLEGRELLVHQSHFIRKITKMMMIRTDDDIHIKDIDVNARMHNNMLQLNPFNFEFDRYKLHMLGVNNFNGKLYYHIAVDKSPVPFPFSINIEGMFHDPKLRFGGPSYDIKRGEEVTSEIQEVNQINLMHVMRSMLTEFICTGAKYKASSQN